MLTSSAQFPERSGARNLAREKRAERPRSISPPSMTRHLGQPPKFVSPSDPAAQWTGAMRGPAFFAYSDNYLIDVKFGIIMDVEASRAIRKAEVGAAKTMIDRTEQRFGLKPERLAADTAYGSGPNLNWLVNDKKIAPHIPVIDMEKRKEGIFSREDFT